MVCCSKGLLPKNEIIATAATQKTIDTVAAQYGVNVTLDNKEAAKADIIVLAVKPVYYAEVIAEIKDVVSSEQIIVTIAAEIRCLGRRGIWWIS